MFHVKQFIKPITALFAFALAVAPGAYASDPYTDTRYNNFSPSESVKDFVEGVSTGVTDLYNNFVQVWYGYIGREALETAGWSDEQLKDWQKAVDKMKIGEMDSSGFDAIVHAQRVKDLVDYANQSTTGLTTGQNVFAFTAKRKLLLGSQNGEQQYELDTMYFWRDYNHTTSVDFTGVTVGNFFLQPNTFYITRQFSDGTFKAFYGDARQLNFNVSTQTGNYLNTPFTITFNAGQTVTCYDEQGTMSSFTFPAQNSTSHTWSTLSFKILDNNLNAIDLDGFQKQAQYNPSFGQYINDGRLTNIQLLCNNASKSDGGMMRPNNYSGSAEGWGTWYLSSGSFLGNSNNSLVVAPQSFTTTNDPLNYDPRKPPANYNIDPLLLTDKQLTPENVSNYNDYGITYNSNTMEFELDIDALAGALAGMLQPDFQGKFDLVYDNQPPIGGSDWTDLTLNYNTDTDNKINDLDVIIKDLLPAEPWQEPSFPALETNPLVDYTYPTLPTQTVPQNVIDDVGTVLDIGFDCIDVLDIAGILIALAVFGAVGYYIWG